MSGEAVGEGGCQCGAVRYRVAAPAREVYCCHCTECRRQSASAFGISVIVPAASITLLRGAPQVWTRPTSAGSWMDCSFCGVCGGRLWHIARDDPYWASVKGGTLDAPPDLSRAAHIWTRSMLPGVVLPPGAEIWPEEPDA